MAAPEYVPLKPVDPAHRSYTSPDYVPDPWRPDRPGELKGGQPRGARLGNQGPDQGYSYLLAERFRDRLRLAAGEHADDVIQGCVSIALRRASLFGRAPMVHDLTIAFTIWGFLDDAAPAELVALRKKAFEGLGHPAHHYDEQRALVDAIPEDTLRMTPEQVKAAYPSRWRELLGLAS
jgi:hypothetical protein